jgi:hypothetical protein
MPHLIPRSVAFEKKAALVRADHMGRELAHDEVVHALAIDAGRLLKEAGIFSRIGGAIAKRLKPKKVGTGAQATKKTIKVDAPPKPKVEAGYRDASPGAPKPGKVQPRVKAPGLKEGTTTTSQAVPGRVKPRAKQPASERVQAGADQWGRSPVGRQGYAQPGAVRPAGGATPGKVTPREQMGPSKAEGLAAEQRAARQAEADKLTGKGKKGWTPGRVAKWTGLGALGVAGLGAYGTYKAAPHVLRAMEQASTTPMAPSMGWSPTPYGYGYTPYGSGSPTMGAGG